MPPPMPVDFPPPPDSQIEHHYILDKFGRPTQIAESIIYIPPRDIDQLHESEPCDQQLDFLEETIHNTEVKKVLISLNKTRRKLFRENGLLKKRMQKLEYENEALKHEIDYIYEVIGVEKRRIAI